MTPAGQCCAHLPHPMQTIALTTADRPRSIVIACTGQIRLHSPQETQCLPIVAKFFIIDIVVIYGIFMNVSSQKIMEPCIL